MPTTTTTPSGYLLQPDWYGTTVAYHGTADANGNRATSLMVETRDKTLVFLDSANYLNFAVDNRSTVTYRLDANPWIGSQPNTMHILMDTLDNLLICYIAYQSNNPYLRVYRLSKPTSGWRAWALGSGSPALSASHIINYGKLPTNSEGYDQSWMNIPTFHVCAVANIANGVLVVPHLGGLHGATSGSASDRIGYSFNLTTGAVITQAAGNTSVMYPATQGSMSQMWGQTSPAPLSLGSQQFSPFSSAGYWWRWYCQDGGQPTQSKIFNSNVNDASRVHFYYWRWSVDANGNLTSTQAGRNAPAYAFKNINDVEASSGEISSLSYSTTFCPSNYPSGLTFMGEGNGRDILMCTIKSGKPTLNFTCNGYAGSANNWTYGATPTNWVFSARVAPTIQWIPERNVVRMWASNGTNGAYMDITWDGTNFTFPATATAIPGLASNAVPFTTQTPMLDMSEVWKGTTLATATSGVSTSYTISSNGSIPEPYVATLKTNNGMKFVQTGASYATTANTAAFGTSLNYLPTWSSFQFRRVSSGAGTEYYNYTTNTWTSSVVNNAVNLFPGGGGFLPGPGTSSYTHDLSGTWADNTSYTYSIVYTDINNVTSTSASRTIATPPVSAAPTSPTPRRLFVFPLNGRTSAHILSIENRVLINKIHIVNTSGSTTTVSLNLGGYNILSSQSVAANQTLQINTAIIANVAERLLATCSADNAITLWVMGTEGV